jgi:mRNA interferase MazF
MTDLKRGDVVVVWFPNSDLKTLKRLPALIVQADGLNTGSTWLLA